MNEYIFRLTFARISDYSSQEVRIVESNTVAAFEKALAMVDKSRALRAIDLFDIAQPPVTQDSRDTTIALAGR